MTGVQTCALPISEKVVGTVRRRKQDVQEVEEVLCYEETAPQHAGT